jgi:predicted CXXCH cytochrome family protein
MTTATKCLFVFVILLLAASLASAQTYSGVSTCQACHSSTAIGGDQYPRWLQTGHGSAYDSVAVIQNNAACLPCHTTGWDTLLANGGFDDYYNAQPRDTVNMARVKNVQCESCHGPVQFGVNHGQPSTVMPEAERCGTCHEGTHHPYYSEWSASVHARSDTSLTSSFLTTRFRTDPGCSGCHTYQGFLEFANDTLAIEPHVQNPPGDAALPLVCASCHDPHGSGKEGSLRLGVAQTCTKCHNPEYSPDSVGTVVGQAVHHSTAYMFEGVGGYEYEGYTYSSSPHTFLITRKCAECHVSTAPFSSGPPEVPAATGHTFEPKKRSCAQAGCHSSIDTTKTDAEVFNFRGTQTEMDSLAGVLADLLSTATNAQDSSSLGFLRAKFNYEFFMNEGSRGIHNTAYARGLLQSSIQFFSLTGVALQDNSVPVSYSLDQNYPNPFNPTTEIRFSLPERSSVSLKVYDISGRLVRTLAGEDMGAGAYRVTWDGRDNDGGGVASGMYLYRLQAGSFNQTRKMLLLK